MSIAPQKGLVAAAGPDYIAFATTESVRKAFESPKEGDADVRNFEPQLKINMPMRISQLAFTADENYLILSAESGGGLAAYEVQSLMQGSTNSAFELPTNGESLRAMVPNPTAEKAELCAIITQSGNLHMANFKSKSVSNSLKAQVSCLSWSAKGKQLCAGLGDGTIYQMTPEGEGKAEIPKPPSLGNCHVSSLTWLENNTFLAIHSTNDSPPSSIYHIITRQNPTSFNYQKMTDPVEPFGSEKTPHHSILRLRNFPPDLDDLLLVSSTASTEVGLLSRSKKPLASDQPENLITGVFTTTELLDDTRRPTLPMTESMDDSMPVGVALDLSSKEKVYRPIPSDEELNESATPVPGLWVLTHEGILCSWWVIYTDSITQGTTYPGLAVASNSAAASTSTPAPSQAAAPAATPSPFSTGNSAFGSAATPQPAFGSSSQMGQKSSPWGSAATAGSANTGGATFGSSAFGNNASSPNAAFGRPSALGFGQSSQLGMRTSPWAAAGGSTPSFGQSGFSSFANKTSESPFGSAAAPPSSGGNESTTPASGGFAGFAKQGGFASLGGNNSGGGAFGSGSKPTPSPFGANTTTESAFTPKQDKPASSPFGSTPFKLESSFKPDPSAQQDANKPAASGSLFGSSFGSALTAAGKENNEQKDDEMDAGEDSKPQEQAKSPFSLPAAASAQPKSLFGSTAASTSQTAAPPKNPFATTSDTSTQPPKNPFAVTTDTSSQSGQAKNPFATNTDTESTTPTSTPAPSRFGAATSPAPGASLFGQPTKLGSSFGSGSLFGSNKDSAPAASGGLFSQSRDVPKAQEAQKSEPKIKVEDEVEAPLPPDTTSKISYPLGESSSSSVTSSAPSQLFDTPGKPESAPLPPFSLPSKSSKAVEDAPLPPFTMGKGKDDSASSDFGKTVKPASDDAPLPPDPTKSKPSEKVEEPPLPPSFIAPKPASKEVSEIPSVPDESEEESEGAFETESEVDEAEEEDQEEDEEQEEEDEDDEDENASEGSGIDVAKDLSPNTTETVQTPGFTPQSSFGGLGGTTPATALPGQQGRTLFGEVSRNAPLFSKPSDNSPRSPSPVRGAIPNRVIRSEASRSVSASGMASQILGHRQPPSHLGASITSRQQDSTDPFMEQHRKQRERQEAAETQPLVDEEDDEIQKILASEVEGTLELDEFVAHSNVAPPAKDSIPAQVEAVYRDINSMIDTLGLNARAIQSFTKGHTENGSEEPRSQEDLDTADGWVLCEIGDLGDVLDEELYEDLENGRVEGREEKLEACQELSRDMHRLRAKQEDLKRVILARMDPEQVEVTRSLPLSVEQAAQQNELRREYGNFTKLLSEAEEALTLLKARIASVSGSSGKGSSNVPTVEAVMRTITKMTSMVEKRSGDVDVLETQLRKMRLGSVSREGSPMMTPQARRSIMMSPDSTPSRNMRHSMSSNSMLFGASARATPPRKKLSGFSKEEKGDLMEKRARRQAVLGKLKSSVEKRGVNVWNMEDIE